jgi:hypothetical protein
VPIGRRRRSRRWRSTAASPARRTWSAAPPRSSPAGPRGSGRAENQLPRFDPALSTAFGGDPSIAYYHGYWRVAPGEALIIEATPPACDYWNFQLNNHWMESLDYRHHRIAVNHATARLRDDGSVRIVVAHEDPGHDNWIDPAGHTFGTMCWRWVRASSHPEPSTRLVKL